MSPPRKIGKILTFFAFFRPTQKIGPDGPKWGQEDFFPTNADLANILGDTDFDFEIFYVSIFLGPKFLAWAQLGPSLGPAWARLGPGLGPAWATAWAQLGPGLGPAWARLGPLGWASGPLGWADGPFFYFLPQFRHAGAASGREGRQLCARRTCVQP